VRAADRRIDHRRHAGLGHLAGLARSTHQVRKMSTDMSAERVTHPPELAQPDPYVVPAHTPIAAPEIEDEVADERLTVATPRQLIWWRFRKHRIALACGVLLAVFYVIAVFAEFVAPYDPNLVNGRYKLVQPVRLTFIDPDGQFVPWPGVNLLI